MTKTKEGLIFESNLKEAELQGTLQIKNLEDPKFQRNFESLVP
jgi:hypothetical protein